MKNKGYVFLIVGLLITCYQLVNHRINDFSEQMKVENTIKKELGYSKSNIDTYDMVLDIPQIKLKRGIYEKSDIRNHIDKNVTIHLDSDYPDQGNSNLILMAHSGTGEKALFKDLHQLNRDSLVKIYYHQKIYSYKIDNFYQVEKNGYASIQRDKNKKTITLITCNQKDKTKQLIYIGYLIDEI